jgi:6-hydroxytryprostatin B O-methyltransferase
LQLIVQDLSAAVSKGAALLPASLKHRITFQEHDMFSPQPVLGAEVYYLRHVLHDWPDEFAVKIIANLVPALKDGARVLISEGIIPPPGTLHGTDERLMRFVLSLADLPFRIVPKMD